MIGPTKHSNITTVRITVLMAIISLSLLANGCDDAKKDSVDNAGVSDTAPELEQARILIAVYVDRFRGIRGWKSRPDMAYCFVHAPDEIVRAVNAQLGMSEAPEDAVKIVSGDEALELTDGTVINKSDPDRKRGTEYWVKIISINRSSATVWLTSRSSPIAASSYTIVLEKVNGQWTVKSKVLELVS